MYAIYAYIDPSNHKPPRPDRQSYGSPMECLGAPIPAAGLLGFPHPAVTCTERPQPLLVPAIPLHLATKKPHAFTTSSGWEVTVVQNIHPQVLHGTAIGLPRNGLGWLTGGLSGAAGIDGSPMECLGPWITWKDIIHPDL